MLKHVLPLLLLAWPAAADTASEMRDHARFHEYYRSWYDSRGASCCNNQDCSPVEYRMRENGYAFKWDGKWWPVPADKVLRKESPDGGAHACVPSWGGRTPADRLKCFVPGNAT